jgi:hypothetical protein
MYSKTNKMNVMKKIISYLASFLIVTCVAAAPGSKILQAFNETFPNAQNVKWTDDKEGYFVSFYQDNNFEKVLYNKEGDFLCSWKYTDGNGLPVNVVMALNKKFSGAKIIGVTELATQNNISYDIKLSKGDKWYAVNALADGTIAKEQKYNN